MTALIRRPEVKWRTAALMAVVGTLFVTLAVVAGNAPSWLAAAAINFLAAGDSLWRQYHPAAATA